MAWRIDQARIGREAAALSAVIGAAAGFYFGLDVLAPFLAAGLGWFIGTFLGRRGQAERGWVSVIAYANLLTWIVPFAGLFVAGATLGLARGAAVKKRRLIALGSIGMVASVVIFGVGTWMLSNPQPL